MAVIIDDFEVVSQPATPAPDDAAAVGEGSPGGEAPAVGAGATPLDLAHLERHRLERAARVWAT